MCGVNKESWFAMKICILSIMNLKHMTLISHYTKFFEDNNIEYDIIYIDKYKEDEKSEANKIFKYDLDIKRSWPLYKKAIKYWKFKSFATKIIEKEKYDFIITWNSFTAIMFSRYLVKNFKNKYIINIRDYAYEKIVPIYLIMKIVVKNSKLTTISSDGFKKFLPKHEYLFVHSLNEKLVRESIEKKMETIKKPLKISFIGYNRFFEVNKCLIDALGNDDRYLLQYYGEGSQVLEEYAKEKKYNNLKFSGRFSSEKTIEFLKDTDIINNIYGSGNLAVDTAISIRLYYSVFFQIPILVSDNTYMSDITKKYNLGFSTDSNYTNLKEELYNWYHGRDLQEYEDGVNEFKEKIEKDNSKFQHKMIEIFL